MNLKLIMLDKIDWPGIIGPQYIINFTNDIFDLEHLDIMEVYIGVNPYSDKDIGIWVKEDHYNRINHSLSYIFLHFDCYNRFDLYSNFKKTGYNNIFEEVDNKKSLNRPHIHMHYDNKIC